MEEHLRGFCPCARQPHPVVLLVPVVVGSHLLGAEEQVYFCFLLSLLIASLVASVALNPLLSVPVPLLCISMHVDSRKSALSYNAPPNSHTLWGQCSPTPLFWAQEGHPAWLPTPALPVPTLPGLHRPVKAATLFSSTFMASEYHIDASFTWSCRMKR